MNTGQATKVVALNSPGTQATNATSWHYVDTLGFSRLRLDAIAPAATATNSSAKWVSMVVGHGATTAVAAHTAISGGTGTTSATASSTQFILPAYNNTVTPYVVSFDVPLYDKERYISCQVTAPADHSNIAIVATLYEAATGPNTAAENGAAVMTILS